jgi:aryl-alcohol dehydrogenase-like predicted oxidoreductase
MNCGNQTDEKESYTIMDLALDFGINFFDTADPCGGSSQRGLAEEIIGRWISQGNSRERIVLAIKLFSPMAPGANSHSLNAYYINERLL